MPGSRTSSSVVFHYVYILENDKDKLYIGYSSDLRERLKEHNLGLNFSTKYSNTWHIIYSEACLTKSDAIRRERYLKTNQGARLLKRRLKDYFYSKRNS